MYYLEVAGGNKIETSYDVWTKSNRFAGIIQDNAITGARVFFNGTCTRGSKRKFANAAEALEFIHTRRVKKGWATE